MSLTPPIGASGIFRLGGPYAALLQTNVSYTCDAVRKMADIIVLGIDPHAEFYAEHGLTYQQYQNDLKNSECIVSLRSNGGHWVYVPTSYILSYPDMGGIPYTALVLGINIGAVPNYLDLSVIKQRIVDLVRETIGVTSTVAQVAISPTKKLPQADHNAIEANRVANITSTRTDRALYLEAVAQRDALALKIQQLEAYIAANLPPP